MNLQRSMIFMPILFILLGGLALPAWSIPGEMTISGRLLDSGGNPVRYFKTEVISTTETRQVEIQASLPARLYFYDDPTTTTAFDTLLTTATAYNGYFNITFPAPAAMLVKDSVWYSVAIDADRNGLTDNDLFPQRLEIGSVPFALSASPRDAYTLFSGTYGGVRNPSHAFDLMDVVPFETPEGGLKFNQMNVCLSSIGSGAAFSFGIFDDQGHRLVWSGLIQNQGATLNNPFLQVKLPVTRLQPSRSYYVGVARNTLNGFSCNPGILPVAPVMGTVPIPKTTGEIPDAFDPSTINPNINIIVLPVTLTMDEDKAPSKVQWMKNKLGGPEYRWIVSGK